MKDKYTVEKEDELLNYLYENIDLPRKKIKSYLTHGSIYVDNTRTTRYDYKLLKGMTITIKSKTSSTVPFEILYEDDYIIVVNKPSGLLTIATLKERDNTLYHIVGEYLRKKRRGAKVFIIHRLDKDTSGIVVLAKDEKTKNRLQEKWNEIIKVREYIAITEGVPSKREDRLVDFLQETKTNLVYIARDGKEAITNYRIIKERNGFAELIVNIETGRKNQIRVQLASINAPIYGDKKYSKKTEGKRLYLHASRLKFFNPLNGEVMTFTAEKPKEFKKIMGNNK